MQLDLNFTDTVPALNEKKSFALSKDFANRIDTIWAARQQALYLCALTPDADPAATSLVFPPQYPFSTLSGSTMSLGRRRSPTPAPRYVPHALDWINTRRTSPPSVAHLR